MVYPVIKQLAAEMIGTYCLVFAGTGAIVVNEVSGGTVTHVGIAITFGLVVMAMIYTMGDISGAHLNPAVTLAFTAAKRFPLKLSGLFIVAQVLGAVVASFCLRLLFPEPAELGGTFPAGSEVQAFMMEIILTFILMFVILSVSTGAKEKGITAGIAIGSVVMLEALFAGPISGASMNPARSLGPAVVTFNFASLWIYMSAPVIGALFAVSACRCVRNEPCCAST